MDTAKKNVAVLASCQALLFTNNSTAIALNGLAGYALAANKALTTLPVTAWVIGGVLSTLPAPKGPLDAAPSCRRSRPLRVAP